jgi:hypothetical protein
MATGRTSQARSVTVTTATSTALTAPAGTFSKNDVGRPISGTGIPAGATLSAVASATAATLSAAAEASATITATIGGDAAANYGFSGWSPETDAEAGAYTGSTAGQNEPSRITDTTTAWASKRRTRT